MRLPMQARLVFFLATGSLLAGCQGMPGHSRMCAGAPSLDDVAAARNLADPNAPFAVPAGTPHLETRPPLLDVTAVPPCREDRLNVFESQAKSTGFHHTVQFTIENKGEACRLGGFPAVTLLRADDSVIASVRLRKVSPEILAATIAPAPAPRDAQPIDRPSPQVLLPENGTAAFQLGWMTGPMCEQVSRIAIAPPGTRQRLTIARSMAVCENRILITAVRPTEPGQP